LSLYTPRRETRIPRPSKSTRERVNALTTEQKEAPAIEVRHLTLTFPDKPGAAEPSAAEAKPELGEAAPTAPATPAPLPAQPTSASMEPSYLDVDFDSRRSASA